MVQESDPVRDIRQILSRNRIQQDLEKKIGRAASWEILALVITACKTIDEIKPEHIEKVNEFEELQQKGSSLGIDVLQVVKGGYDAVSSLVLAPEASNESITVAKQIASRVAVAYGHFIYDRYFWVVPRTKKRDLGFGFESLGALDFDDRKEVTVEKLMDSHSHQLDALEKKGYSIVGGTVVSTESAKWLLSDKKIISAGGYGCVYRATSKKHGCDVAMKLSKLNDTECKYGLVEEAKNLREVEQSTCKRFTRLLEEEEINYEDETFTVLILPWYARGSLASYCATLPENKLPPWQAVYYFRQILEALVYLGSKRIMHRDIKPGNFLLEDDLSNLVLIDFGFCRAETDNATATRMVGSEHFFAPEVAHTTDYDSSIDCYSAGITLYYMLTGAVTKQPMISTVEANLLRKTLLDTPNLTKTDADDIIKILKKTLTDKDQRLRAEDMLFSPECEVYAVIQKAKFTPPKPVVKKEVTKIKQDKLPGVPLLDEGGIVADGSPSPPQRKGWLSSVLTTVFPSEDQKAIRIDQSFHDSCGGVDIDAFD